MISGPTAFHVFGIPVRLSVTLLVPVLLLTMQLGSWGLAASVLLFASVLLHELGHALVARRYGIPVASIHLHMLGGLAMMVDMPRRPNHEIAIAAAGPAVSLGLGVLFAIAAASTGGSLAGFGGSPADLLAYASALNFAMAAFNMIPALPMDGGRVLRAVWASWRGWERGTRAAGRISRFFAVAFVVTGIAYGAWSLALIGVVVWFLSKREERIAELRERPRPRLQGVWVRGPMGWVLVPSPVVRSTFDHFDARRG